METQSGLDWQRCMLRGGYGGLFGGDAELQLLMNHILIGSVTLFVLTDSQFDFSSLSPQPAANDNN